MAIQTVTNVSPQKTVVEANNEYLKQLILRIKKDFIELGLALLKFRGEGQYLHYYDSFSDYVENELHFNKSTAYNLIAIATRFTINGQVKPEFAEYSYSQLSCLLPVSDEDIKSMYPASMSVSEIKDLKKRNNLDSKRLENIHNFKFRKIGISCWFEADVKDNYHSTNSWDNYILELFQSIKSDVLDNDSEYEVIIKKVVFNNG